MRPASQGPQTHGASVECILLRHLVSPKVLWSKNLAHLLFIQDKSVDVCFLAAYAYKLTSLHDLGDYLRH